MIEEIDLLFVISCNKLKQIEIIEQCLKLFKEQLLARKIQVENTIPDSLPVLHTDKPKFYRLFELLLKDELATLPAGSKISFTAELQNNGNKPEIVVQLSGYFKCVVCGVPILHETFLTASANYTAGHNQGCGLAY